MFHVKNLRRREDDKETEREARSSRCLLTLLVCGLGCTSREFCAEKCRVLRVYLFQREDSPIFLAMLVHVWTFNVKKQLDD